ncbi:MAG: hypothetical protein HKM07_02320 [Chlamydiae bacterium]|nr:hypothetical protein [Chlamydiota bacterium]
MKFLKQFFLLMSFTSILLVLPGKLCAEHEESPEKIYLAYLNKHGCQGLRIHKNPISEEEKAEEATHAAILNILLSEAQYQALGEFIKLEKDLDYRIEWLRRHAEKGHVHLMVHLANDICLRSNEKGTCSEEEKREAVKWYILATHCANLDAACSSDKSIGPFLDVITPGWGECLRLIIKENEANNFLSPKKILEIVKGWTPTESNPSPIWLTEYGRTFGEGKNSLYPKETWLERRKKEHLEVIKVGESL